MKKPQARQAVMRSAQPQKMMKKNYCKDDLFGDDEDEE